jgi:putative transposase
MSLIKSLLSLKLTLLSIKVIQALQRTIEFRRKPKSIRIDNGSEFISHKLEQWCYIHQKEWVYDYNNYRSHSTLGKLSPIEYLYKYDLEKDYSI